MQPRAHTTLARILNGEVLALIAWLQGAPIPKSGDTQSQAQSLRVKFRRVTDALYYSMPVFGDDITISDSHTWPEAIELISTYVPGVSRQKIDLRARRMVEEMAWFSQKLFQEQRVLEGSVPQSSSSLSTRKAATKKLVASLVRSADKLFKKPLTVIDATGVRGGEIAGPAIVFLAATLALVRDTLRDVDLPKLAADPALKIPRSTLRSWFYEYRNKTKA